MAGSVSAVTVSEFKIGSATGKKYTCTLTCDSSGALSGNQILLNGRTPDSGFLMLVRTIPGTPAPVSYNLTLLGDRSIDILDGKGASRSATAGERIKFAEPNLTVGALTPVITGAITNGAIVTLELFIVGM